MTSTALSETYLELHRAFPLRPIRTEEELDRATVIVLALAARISSLNPDEADYLDVLSDLIEKYESVAYPEPDMEPHVMLRELIAFRGCTQVDVARETGIAESVMSEILSGKRKMGRKTIERFSSYFHVDPGVFFRGKRKGTGQIKGTGAQEPLGD